MERKVCIYPEHHLLPVLSFGDFTSLLGLKDHSFPSLALCATIEDLGSNSVEISLASRGEHTATLWALLYELKSLQGLESLTCD